MYPKFFRPVLFLFPPEFIHRLVAFLLPLLVAIPGMRLILRKTYCLRDKRLERQLFGLTFKNPVGIAAGFDKEARLYNALGSFGFSHVEIGTVTPVGQKGNPRPRLFRLPKDKALINRMGFNNEGMEAVALKLRKQQRTIIIGGNIGKNTLTPNESAHEDYLKCFNALFDLVDYFVVNVSCPNIKGMSKLQDTDKLLFLLQNIQENNRSRPAPKPVLLKISPDLSNSQLDEVIEIVKKTGLDGIIATNTSTSREQLTFSSEEAERIGQGGLSGKPLREKSTQTIRYLHQRSGGTIPIIGVGGISSAEDALEKLAAGASLVQLYTGFVYEGPSIAKKINRKLLQLKHNEPVEE
ncbi:MAG: quinone-dependent dihydroorotate dehydrogenase [Bacteroidales bacterium]|nr:quinone-dependent dihydroorotate dehydrogenase [Bacteroidales bacterium]